MTFVALLAVVVFVASAALARRMAAQRGLQPAFWFAMGLTFGPLVLPVLLLIRQRGRA
jgi:hypothetical protein